MPKDKKIEALEAYFRAQLPDCKVVSEWKIDKHCFRFYFEKNGMKGWEYILDLYQQDLEQQEPEEVIQQLEKSKWKEVLSANSKKRVPVFKDKRFSEFHNCP
jgi:hypothetical protein